ncbi:MAG: hypothetical protein Kow0047_00240 [Anaerolineae bacterium]
MDNKEQILEILKQRGPTTVGELAQALNLSRSATRHHLRVLERQRLVAPQGTSAPSGVGRPGLLYGLTPQAQDAFPHGYDRLAQALMREMKATLGASEVAQSCERIGKSWAAEAPKRKAGQRLSSYLQQVSAFLSDRGYLARVAREGDGWVLELANCPYAHVAQAHSEVCCADVAMLRQLLGDELEVNVLWARDSRSCRFHVPA